jgi:Family of unknown function (DUF6334)
MTLIPLLKEVVDSFGAVKRIAVDDVNPVMLSVICITFENGDLNIEAVAEDDSLNISIDSRREGTLSDVSSGAPWRRLVGGSPLWIWTLTNQQGFVDGIQFLVRTGRGDVMLQLVVIASSLKPNLVG